MAQQPAMPFEVYDPTSTLVVPEHPRTRAKFPFVDIHSHQRRDMSADDVRKLVEAMDRINMGVMVNLSGGTGAALQEGIAGVRVV